VDLRVQLNKQAAVSLPTATFVIEIELLGERWIKARRVVGTKKSRMAIEQRMMKRVSLPLHFDLLHIVPSYRVLWMMTILSRSFVFFFFFNKKLRPFSFRSSFAPTVIRQLRIRSSPGDLPPPRLLPSPIPRFNCENVQGRRWLTYTLAAPSQHSDEAEKRLRGRKITPKRGGRDDRRREFSECCNRHEWGLIDDPPLPPSGRRSQLAGRNFTNFHYGRRQAARAETRARHLDCSLARARELIPA